MSAAYATPAATTLISAITASNTTMRLMPYSFGARFGLLEASAFPTPSYVTSRAYHAKRVA